MGYEALLKRARSQLPEAVLTRDRFELPKVRGHVEGNKVIISNFPEVAQKLRREPEHLFKYLLKELAAPGDIRRNLTVIGTKIGANRINDKIKQYADEFVFCPQCGKPDTDIKKEGEFSFLVCQVCGSRTPVKSKI